MTRRRSPRILFIVTLFTCWLIWDLSQADKNRESEFESYKLAAAYDAAADAAKVVIVRSDDPALQNPVPVNEDDIDYPTIEQMVRRAIELAGGLKGFIHSGDTVLIKPNIVDPEKPGTGEVTDVRVVKALVKVVDEIDHGDIDIVIGEGSPRPMNYEMKYQTSWSSPCWQELWDVCGYQDLLRDSDLAGIRLRLSNLNGSPAEDPWQDLVEIEIPNGQASPQGGRYWIHKDVLDADAYITVPVMKIHTVGMTCALKNQIGLAPSSKYGFSKNAGVPQDSYVTKLTHHSQAPKHWTDKEIVDLSSIAGIDFVLVDAIACLERSKTAERKNGVITNLVRMNTIIAGADPVATDHVCARLMGLNPDDMEHITLAERVGLGTNQAAQITVVGATIESTARRFIKSTAKTGDYGQGNRDWLVSEAFSIDGIDDPMEHAFLPEAEIAPQPGRGGWSEPLYFTDDRIDLRGYFDNRRNIVSYAFTYFEAPRTQEAELWLGSDEAMKIWLNGSIVYDYDKTRTFADDDLYLDKVSVLVNAGENRLLVKTLHKFSLYDFSVNICEPEADSRYDGNRIWGLKFKTSSAHTAVQNEAPAVISDLQVGQAYPNPFNHTVRLSMYCDTDQDVTVAVYNVRGEKVKTLDAPVDRGESILSWDGIWDGNQLAPSGLYFVQIRHSNQVITRKISLVR